MANIKKGFLNCWQPTLQFVRFRKVNVQKPFPPHFERAVVEHVCKPILPRNPMTDNRIPIYEKCVGNGKYWQKVEIENPYVTLIAKDMLNWFNHSKLIAFFHINPMSSDEKYEARVALKKLGMRFNFFGREVVSKAVNGTKYEAVLNLYQSHTVVAYGPEPNVKGLIKAMKKIPKLILLGAVVDDRLMSRAELDYVNKLPDLQTARAGLVSVLNSAAQGVVSNLTHHQRTLVAHLTAHAQSTDS